METILLCTVGGSPQPILTAIERISPDFIQFFCTGRDDATGRQGSEVMINSPGPNSIPTQANLKAGSYKTALVPADDFDGCFGILMEAIASLQRDHAEAELIADYTGGTKTMTACLVLAALEHENIKLNLVSGARSDLVRVCDGTQRSYPVTVERVRLRRGMAPYALAWSRYGYGEAAEGLLVLEPPSHRELNSQLQVAQDTSKAFDAWDRFDHGRSAQLLEHYRTRLFERYSPYYRALKVLNGTDSRQTPARIWDLWLNAERRAHQARYDDAVARLYRFVEWIAQWLLTERGLNASNLTPEDLPEPLNLQPGPDGRIRTGLMQSWELASHVVGGDVMDFWETTKKEMLNHIESRNSSILAHGHQPIDRERWTTFHGWLGERLVPLFKQHTRIAGIRELWPQLPDRPCW